MVREQKVLLLRRLQRKLQSLALSLQVPPAAIGATVVLFPYYKLLSSCIDAAIQ